MEVAVGKSQSLGRVDYDAVANTVDSDHLFLDIFC